MKIIENWFRASDGKHIFYNEFLPENIEQVKFVVQIFHGMAEHSERYTNFAEFLVKNGAAVYISDHRGHGRNALKPGEYGVWEKKGTWLSIVDDLKILNDLSAKNFPEKPNFILGHSMGSFLARSFITRYSTGLKGVILTGTGTNSNFILKFGKFIAWLQCYFAGPAKPAKLLNKLSFGSFNKKYDKPYQWLSRKQEVVDEYIKDPYCGGIFSCSFYYNFFSGLLCVNNLNQAKKIAKDLPIFFLSGDQDPVGNYSKGVEQAIDFYKKAKLNNIELKLYSGARHEILNETNNLEVYQDILDWISKHI